MQPRTGTSQQPSSIPTTGGEPVALQKNTLNSSTMQLTIIDIVIFLVFTSRYSTLRSSVCRETRLPATMTAGRVCLDLWWVCPSCHLCKQYQFPGTAAVPIPELELFCIQPLHPDCHLFAARFLCRSTGVSTARRPTVSWRSVSAGGPGCMPQVATC